MAAVDLAEAPPAATPPAAAPRAVQWLRALVFAALIGLIVLGLAWELWLAPLGGRSLALKVLPLAAALPGVVRHRLYTHRWLSLLVWLYFTEGMVRATSEHGVVVPLALAEVLLSMVVFVACSAYVRLRLRAGKAAAATP